LPGGEIIPAMDRGLLDGAEFNNASSDRLLGFPDVSKVCMLQSFHQNAEQFEIIFNKTKYDALPDKMQAIIANAVEAASADMTWKAIDRYSQDYIELQTKQNVKFYKTPDTILQKQIELFDQIAAKKAADNPMFKEIIDSQKAFAARRSDGSSTRTQPADGVQPLFRAEEEGLAELVMEPAGTIRAISPGWCPVFDRTSHRNPLPPMNAQKFLNGIDRISTWAGKASAWLILTLTIVVCVEVFKRYILNAPTAWIFDVDNMMYGTLFMMCGAYTLAQNGHVRGDFLYSSMRPRTQAWLDLVLYSRSSFPGIARSSTRAMTTPPTRGAFASTRTSPRMARRSTSSRRSSRSPARS
jgi:hypothetical protein